MTRRRGVRIGLAVALAAGGGIVWWLSRPTELDHLRTELDRADPGWRFSELWAVRLADQPPPERNATLAALAVRPLPPEYLAWRAAAVPDRWPWDVPAERRWPADPGREAAWRASASAVVAARRVADLSPGMVVTQFPSDPYSVLLPHAQDSREVCELLALDAVEATAHGDPAGATASVRAMLAVGRSVGREPFFICQLIRRADGLLAARATVRALATGEWPADALARTQAELAAETDPAVWVEAVRCWRAGLDNEFDAVAEFRSDLSLIAGSPTYGAADRLRYRARLRDDQALVLAHLTDLVAAARRPPHEWAAATAARPLPPDDWQHLLSRAHLAGHKRLVASAVYHQALLHTAVLAISCERFRLVHGRWPDSLTELPPADFSDPYTGRPLLLKRLPDGLVVYSVGPDGTDDGGTLSSVGSPPAGADLGYRRWDVSVRRQIEPMNAGGGGEKP